MKIQRIISVLLVFLLITSITVPAVSAEPAPLLAVAPAIPEVASIVIGAVTVVMTGVAALKIAENLGNTWDNTQKGWDQLMKDTGDALNNLFNANKWVDANSPEAKAVLTFDYYIATAGDGSKKDDKLYHKAKRDEETRKIKINTERISEKDAATELKEGRDIFTVTKELAEKVLDRAFGEGSMKKFENHGLSKDGRCCKRGYYDHYHPENQPVRPHCWIWGTL